MHHLPRTTPSLRLRHLVPADTRQVMALNAQTTTRRWLPSHVYASVAAAEAAIEYLIGCYASPGHPQQGPYVLAVEHVGSGELLGHVGFSPLRSPQGGAEVEVSYAIAESARGRGHGSEALMQGCSWVAQTFALTSVVAVTASANTASRRLLERCGFAHERDEVERFQGLDAQAISHYRWRAGRA